MAHSCPDGTRTKLVRTGPIGEIEGVTFTCPRCGHAKSGANVIADFEKARPLLVAALR